MDLPLDTHALIWFLEGDDTRLSAKANQLIIDPANVSYVSMATLWEMAIKIRLGTLTFQPGHDNLFALFEQNGFELLPITMPHTRSLITLPMHHRDPFDRLLIAQCITEDLRFITADSNIHLHDVDWPGDHMKLMAARYFYEYGLVKTISLAQRLQSADRVTLDMPGDWF